ncbi:energy-coupling factor transporter ATPase [Mogibacterium timidum]|uniref:Energy-coupling factor transporter ATP-binding protein EcfA2 n=1 Tax=Mogibacterium timidum ATCC 33093 TaxID=1401079 RepID=X8JA98_9FIRM|nr:energy-coupling factor transporter ATPase [Mogibacterium timidum]EUC58141.1 ABC transporter, ATP-binding protein [Mogibacterium timidum ATCC 33093]
MSIITRHLKYIYSKGLPGETIAIDDISFEIADGECVGVIGHTGSGKSTLLQHMNGLLRPHSGEIFVADMNIGDDSVKKADISRSVGLVFQYPEYQLFEETVEKDVAFGPRNLGVPDQELPTIVRESLELLGLDCDELADKSPFELSGGQKRRVAIAGVLAMKPRVLILDEPTAGLDPASKREMLDVIKKLRCDRELIVVFVSHNMKDIAELSDRVLVMNGGKLVMIGTPEEVFARASELKGMGLSVPPVTEIIYELSEKLQLPFKAIFEEREAAEYIAAHMMGRQG